MYFFFVGDLYFSRCLLKSKQLFLAYDNTQKGLNKCSSEYEKKNNIEINIAIVAFIRRVCVRVFISWYFKNAGRLFFFWCFWNVCCARASEIKYLWKITKYLIKSKKIYIFLLDRSSSLLYIWSVHMFIIWKISWITSFDENKKKMYKNKWIIFPLSSFSIQWTVIQYYIENYRPKVEKRSISKHKTHTKFFQET